MTQMHDSNEPGYKLVAEGRYNWRRLAIGGTSITLTVIVVLCSVSNIFFKYVPPGKHLVIIAKNGSALDPW